MTFKDKEPEIEAFIEEYKKSDPFIFKDLELLDEKYHPHLSMIILKFKNNMIGFYKNGYSKEKEILFDGIYKNIVYSKSEIKFIYNFIEFLESLGFKEGE